MATPIQATSAATTRASVRLRSRADTGRSVATDLTRRLDRCDGTGTMRRPGSRVWLRRQQHGCPPPPSTPSRVPRSSCRSLGVTRPTISPSRKCSSTASGRDAVLSLPRQGIELELQRTARSLTRADRVAHVAGLVVGDDRGALDVAHRVVATAYPVFARVASRRAAPRPGPALRVRGERSRTLSGRPPAANRAASCSAEKKPSLLQWRAQRRVQIGASVMPCSRASEHHWPPRRPGAARCRGPAHGGPAWAPDDVAKVILARTGQVVVDLGESQGQG